MLNSIVVVILLGVRVTIAGLEHSEPEDLNLIRAEVKNGVSKLESIFGRKMKSPVKILLVSRMSEYENLSRWWIGGRFVKGWIILQPLRSLKKKGVFKKIILNEVCHCYLREVFGEQINTVFEHGFCLVFSGLWQRVVECDAEKISNLREADRVIKNADRFSRKYVCGALKKSIDVFLSFLGHFKVLSLIYPKMIQDKHGWR